MSYKVNHTYNNIIAVDVFLERFETRLYVGRLQKVENHFQFKYNEPYIHEKNIISLGPEFPLTKSLFTSPTLFESLKDRIPDPENPAYEDYCKEFGIPPETKDPLVLLSTIGRRGPSSFIFEPVYGGHFAFEDFDQFRKDLGLSLSDAALLFDVSLSSLQKIRAEDSSGKEVLKRLELYYLFNDALEHQIKNNGKFLHVGKLEKVFAYLTKSS